MKNFIFKVCIFCFPFFLLLGFPFILLYRAGEFMDTEKIINLRQQKSVLIGRRFLSDTPADLVIKSVQRDCPKVLVLGNSRSLEIRKNFFKEGVTFYNGSRSVYNVDEFEKILDIILPFCKPEIVLIGLEPSLFNANVHFPPQVYDGETREQQANYFLSIWKNFYKEYFDKKISFSSLDSNSTYVFIGMNANLHKSGTRNDGSYYYGSRFQDSKNSEQEDFQFRDTYRRVDEGSGLFAYGTDLNTQSVVLFTSFLEKAKKNNIHVVAFIPPYAPSVYEKMMTEKSGKYDYIKKIVPTFSPLVEKLGFTLMDFSDSRAVGIVDDEMIDGFHSSEKGTLRYFLFLIEKDLMLSTYTDTFFLHKILLSTSSTREVFREL